MANYGWDDWWSTSPAENLKSQYSSLLGYLDREIEKLKRSFLAVKTSLDSGFENCKQNVSKCEGVVPQLLLDKIEKSNKDFDKILTAMETAVSDLEKKQVLVSSRLEQLEWYCKNEDAREKEYSYKEIKL